MEIAGCTDWLNMQGDAHIAVADVLRLAGTSTEAVDAARQAFDRYDRKGNVWPLAGLALLKELDQPSR